MALRKHPAPASAPEKSALDELLATEQEIATQIAAATGEAESLIAAARAEGDALKLKGEAALGVEVAQAEANAAAARTALERKLEAEGERLVVRYRTLAQAEIAALAAFIIYEATGLGPVEVR